MGRDVNGTHAAGVEGPGNGGGILEREPWIDDRPMSSKRPVAPVDQRAASTGLAAQRMPVLQALKEVPRDSLG